MSKCKKCNGTGLVAQGESIKTVCKECAGKGEVEVEE